MKNLLIAAATVAALSFSPAAFAGEGNGEPFPPAQAPVATQTVTGGSFPADVGSAAYPAFNPALSFPSTYGELLPVNGSNSAVETANSVPRDAFVGTVQYAQAQEVNRYFAQAAARHYAQARLTRPRS